MYYPSYRMRRLRRTDALRRGLRETTLRVEHLVLPMFVSAGQNIRQPVPSLPGVFQLSIGNVISEIRETMRAGVRAVLLYGIPSHRDAAATGAYDPEGVVQMAVRAVKDEFPELLVITDVCLCAYMDHGQCGVLQDGEIMNDATVELLGKTAVTHAESGADIVSPSDMMDGRVAAIRNALDDEGLIDTAIMPSSTRFSTSFCGPADGLVRETSGGDRRATYLLDYANAEEAVREALLDIEEGADIVMVEPALPYLDIIRTVKQETKFPVAAMSTSGEYAMLKSAAASGWCDEEALVLEATTAMKRAGADLIATYFAADLARWLS